MSLFILVLFSSFCCLLDSFHQMRSERGAQSEKKETSLLVYTLYKAFHSPQPSWEFAVVFANFNNFLPELEGSLH